MSKPKVKLPPQLVIVFGAPLSGTTSSIHVLTGASEMPTEVLYGVDHDTLDTARTLIRAGTTVFIDDFEPTVEHIQRLHDSRLVYPGVGTLVRMWSDDSDVLARAHVRGRSDVTHESLAEFRQSLIPVDERIRALSMPYMTVPNGMMFEFTVKELARIAGITK